MASITLENVSVSFPVYSASTRSLKNRLIQSATGGQIRADATSQRISVVQALQNINLSLQSGDRIGLVGHNGAGKTTLLRVLGGIYEPNSGRVAVQGSTVPLFDISLGMDQESTGYENIILRGLFLGLTRQQIKARMDEIADFTGLGPFLAMPLKTYSAGMQARLAFAVATAVHADVILMDEWIAVGDADFQKIAHKRILELMERAGILVLASHDLELIRLYCNKVMRIESGVASPIMDVKKLDELLAAA